MKYTRELIGRMFNVYPKNIEIRYVSLSDGELLYYYRSDDSEYGFTQIAKLKEIDDFLLQERINKINKLKECINSK